MRMLGVLGILVMLMGCRTFDVQTKDAGVFSGMTDLKVQLMMMSSSFLGCAPEQIAISEYFHLGYTSESWTASCGDRRMTCAFMHTQYHCVDKEGSKIKRT